MCFSPEISFAASAALAVIGGMTLKKATHRDEILFASIPMIFAAQQFVEGMLWLILLKGGTPLQQYWITQAYAVFVGVVWPTVVPLSILLIEPQLLRKKLLGMIAIVGGGIALYTLHGIRDYGISSEVVNYCIQYNYPLPQPNYIKWIYVAVTCLPFFIARQPILHKIGSANFILFLVAYESYHATYVSVWCFFAGVVSGLIYFYFRDRRRDEADLAVQPVPAP